MSEICKCCDISPCMHSKARDDLKSFTRYVTEEKYSQAMKDWSEDAIKKTERIVELEKANDNCISLSLHEIRIKSLEGIVEDLKLQIADRSEKYKLFVDKGLWSLNEKNKELNQKLEKFTEENIAKVIMEWKSFWMNQTQNSEEDRKNYFDRAFGIDANMKYDLARRISELNSIREGRNE